MARKKGQYDVCPYCKDNIDAGSVCDCRRNEEARTDGAVRTSNTRIAVNTLLPHNTTNKGVCQDGCSLD